MLTPGSRVPLLSHSWNSQNSVMFTTACQWSLHWAQQIQFAPSHPISLRSTLILSSLLQLCLPSGLVWKLCIHISSLIHATCPTYITLVLIFCTSTLWNRSWDSAVRIATGYGLDDQGVRDRVSLESIIFSSPSHPDWFRGPPSLHHLRQFGLAYHVHRGSDGNGSHRLVLTAARRILRRWFSGACEMMGQVPECTVQGDYGEN
jgi:hypothetical protein